LKISTDPVEDVEQQGLIESFPLEKLEELATPQGLLVGTDYPQLEARSEGDWVDQRDPIGALTRHLPGLPYFGQSEA
jgi:hypothetical protein